MEKLIRLILIVLLICGFSGNGFAEDLFFDEEFKQFKEEYLGGMAECRKLKSMIKQGICQDDFREKIKNDPRKRGGEGYFNKHYAVLDFETLEDRLDELKLLYKKAPKFSWTEKQKPGVLYDAIFGAEIQLIEQLQGERYRVTYCEEQKKNLEKITAPMDYLPPVCKQYFKEKEVEERLKKKGLK